ncbi:DUF4157 domain-containing protein [Streptomyces sp. NPDC102283]|uniref:eCIS core domain-containing protein n=1 Tax=Streptomyces sp. NPDC102283 TaxID=3366155 RepID=UPI00382D2D8D
MRANDSARDKETRNSQSSAVTPTGRATTSLTPLSALQRNVGNAAVVQMLRQAGHPWAQNEHRHTADCSHRQTGQPVQRSTVPDVLRSPGCRLDDNTRTEMEGRLGADFSDVRIHTDTTAQASAAEVGARAYTSGHHVVIGDGGTDKHTLAHELTHVIQQRQGPVAGTDNGNGLSVSNPSDRFEREAEANAQQAMAGPGSAPGSEGPAMTTVGAATTRATAIQRVGTEEGPSEKAKGKRKRDTPYNELVKAWEATPEHARRFARSGPDQLGALTTDEQVQHGARTFQGERPEQTMRHIAIRLLTGVQHLRAITPNDKKPPAEAEFQGMLINDRIVLSSNINASIDLLEALHGQNATPFRDMLGMETPLTGLAASGHKEAPLINKRRRAARAGIGRVLKTPLDDEAYEADDERPSAGKAPEPARNATGEVLVRATRPSADEGKAAPKEKFAVAEVDLANTEMDEGLRQLLTSDEHKNMIILIKTANDIVTGDNSVMIHAEQKLIAALKAARITPSDIKTGNFLVRGTKRPCLACGALLRHVSDNLFGGRLSVNRNSGAYFMNALRAVEAYSLGQPWDHSDAMDLDHEPTDVSQDTWHAQMLEQLKSSAGHVSVIDEKETRTFETASSGYDSEDLNEVPLRNAQGLVIPDTWKPADTVKKQKTGGVGARYKAGETSPDFTEEHKLRIKAIIGGAVWEQLNQSVRGASSRITDEQWQQLFALEKELLYTDEALRRALALGNSTFSRARMKHKKKSESLMP